ncbi:MAG: carboxylate--amine ligase [Acidimicrobiia bacterium]|nr:carboxylate--amine ligase [Acidimicrobiia bacterium]
MPHPDVSTAVVILSGQTSLHYGGLGVARSLGRWGVPIHWAHPLDNRMALASRYVDRVLPLSIDLDLDEAARQVADFGASIGGRPILIPVDDRAASILGENASLLAESYRFTTQQPDLVRCLGDKQGLHDLCLANDIPTARIWVPGSAAELDAALSEASYPVVLKRIANWADHGLDRPSVTIARNRSEVALEYVAEDWTRVPNILIQEYIPGGPETIWMFNGYFDGDSRCLFGLAGRKLRQSPAYTGFTSLGVCEPDSSLVQQTTSLLTRLGYTGPVDLGYRYDARDGTHKLLDVNPRVGSTFRLFVDSQDMDVIRTLYLDLTDQPVEVGQPIPGRKWILEPNDLVSAARYYRDEVLTLAEWARSLSGLSEGAWWARDDLRPFAGVLRYSAGRILPRLSRSNA